MKTSLLSTIALTASLAAGAQLAAVNLGSTSNFAVLAGSLVSNIPTSAITGDLGLSPATGGNITGFGPGEVTGIVYTVDASGPAGSVPAASRLTTAKGNLTTAFNEARDRTPVPAGPFLNPGSGDVGGMTLAPGLYKFTGAAAITGSNLTLSGTSTDVWIFRSLPASRWPTAFTSFSPGERNPATFSGRSALRRRWERLRFSREPSLRIESISLNTGATLNGRALASSAAVTLASNTITVPATPAAIAGGSKSPSFALFQNAPNSAIAFIVPSNGTATLKLFNTSGRQVATLFNGAAQGGKLNQVNPAGVTKGLYFSELKFDGKVELNKLLLIN